jgi:hypothetical protein
MREILFRGKSNCSYGKVKKGDWLYGMTISRHCYDDEEIISYYIGSGNNTIDGKTLGQYTGLPDINNRKIFEGDIVRIDGKNYEVQYLFGQFFVGINMPIAYKRFECEIIGNVHDNPELLKGGEQG